MATRRCTTIAASIALAMTVTAGAFALQPQQIIIPIHDAAAPTASSPAPSPAPSSSAPTYPNMPSTTAAETSASPLIWYDAVNPQLLIAGVSVTPVSTWETATISRDTPVYGEINSAAIPIGHLAASPLTTPAVTDTAHVTKVAVFGHFGGWLLVGTPSRTSTPNGRGHEAPATSFGYIRAADVLVQSIAKKIVVDTKMSAVSIVARVGSVIATDSAVMGVPGDMPTASGALGYLAVSYINPAATDTMGQPINLTSAHSPTLATFDGSAALTAIHASNIVSAGSHGCVRVSANFTNLIASSNLIGAVVEFV
ncbi:hypothetical protein ACVXZ4_04090 [Lacisediminihabitans sp. FW035]